MTSPVITGDAEVVAAFACFGGHCEIHVAGAAPRAHAARAAADARAQLLAWHRILTRFSPGSELSMLNADPRPSVPVSETLGRLGAAVAWAGALSDGLVDGTLARAIADAGYTDDLSVGIDLPGALASAPPRRAAGARAQRAWAAVRWDAADGVLHRPVGVALDSGGLAKGLAADVLAEGLRAHPSFAIDCAGDLRVGGTRARPRRIHVADPFVDGGTVGALTLTDGAVATSGIGRRSWRDGQGRPCHHLLDPATGRPAFTGLVQATALAPTALEAEVRAKAAVLSGPDGAAAWLSRWGGMTVADDEQVAVYGQPPAGLVASA